MDSTAKDVYGWRRSRNPNKMILLHVELVLFCFAAVWQLMIMLWRCVLLTMINNESTWFQLWSVRSRLLFYWKEGLNPSLHTQLETKHLAFFHMRGSSFNDCLHFHWLRLSTTVLPSWLHFWLSALLILKARTTIPDTVAVLFGQSNDEVFRLVWFGCCLERLPYKLRHYHTPWILTGRKPRS